MYKKPLVYVAGPYSHPDPVENTHLAIRAGLALWEEGQCAVIIPHLMLLAHVIQPREINYWYQLDLDQLAHCNAIYRLPGESTGADKERSFADARGIPVFYEVEALREWLTFQELG